jgi:hypothetical protein
VQECLLKEDGTCVCSCLKAKLLHKPCSHVMSAAAECGIAPDIYVLDYHRKETIGNRERVCLIHDCHAGLLRAILNLQKGCTDIGEVTKWSDVQSRWCMRHMGANIFKQFKNKQLMNMFKRLCRQNDQRKFNKLWEKLGELTTKQRKEQSERPRSIQEHFEALGPLPTDTERTRRRTRSSVKIFSEWIENEPKEKWDLLYDTDGSRYDIMTTNFAEVYNWAMRGVRGLSLVAIVEFIVYGTNRYFRSRFQEIQPSLNDNNILFGKMLTDYMIDKAIKAKVHQVEACGTH